MTSVTGDIKHANLVDFLLSQLCHWAPWADDTNRLQRLRVYLTFSFVQADRNQPQREILAPYLMLSSQMSIAVVCAVHELTDCLLQSLSVTRTTCVFPKVVPQTRGWTWKTKGMNRSGSRRRKEGGRQRVAANPITVAAKWFVPLGEQQVKKKIKK